MTPLLLAVAVFLALLMAATWLAGRIWGPAALDEPVGCLCADCRSYRAAGKWTR